MTFATRLNALAVLGALALPCAAWAQKPALTESIDEPGRNPYSEQVNAAPLNSGAPGGFFSSVPAGKRLVIKHINCYFSAQSSFTSSPVTFILFPDATGLSRQYFALSDLGGGIRNLNADLLAFANSGDQPSYYFGLGPASGSCTLTGYYISVP